LERNLSGQSNLVKNGQQLRVGAGAGAIAVSDLVEIGGPGNQAWSVATADYAANAGSGTLLAQTSVVAAALPAGGTRQPVARDRLGNIYIAGTNSSGNLVATKYSPLGTVLASATLDATATSVNTPYLFQLQNGTFAVVYARAAGALYFTIFDAALTVIAGPSSVATERSATNVVYHAACALSGGGFALAFQTSAGTAINLATFSNAGSSVLAATNIQTLAGSAAQQFLRLAQLSSGNLVCAYRGTMTAGGTAGTSFTIVTTSGGAVAGPINLDSTSTLGFLEISILPGFFALAEANGTNLVAGVFSNAGAQQGSTYTVGNTLASTTYPQTKLTNDGSSFWLAWFSSVANGLYAISFSAAGVAGVAASALGGATLNASTFALDAIVMNGLLVALAASSTTGGQYLMTVGLPDASQGIAAPYLRMVPTSFGTSAGTTGSRAPRLLGGGDGLYSGSNPPAGQPSVAPTNGDFTVILAYDQQSTAATFLGIQKVETTAIVGVALAGITAGNPGSTVLVNPGQGEYPANAIAGTAGTGFNHLVGHPQGAAGRLYPDGVALSGLTDIEFNPSAMLSPSGYMKFSNGLILQWGVTAPFLTEGGATITYPIPFPNNNFTQLASADVSAFVSSEANIIMQTYSPTLNGMGIYCQFASGTITDFSFPARWIAIGN
jgi:hypothetical protein